VEILSPTGSFISIKAFENYKHEHLSFSEDNQIQALQG